MRSPSWPKERAKLKNVSVRVDEHIMTLLDQDTSSFALLANATVYHKVGPKFDCADDFLQICLAALVHPGTTTDASCVRRLSDQ